MRPSDKRQSITLLIGGVSAALVILFGLVVADIPVHLRSLVSNATAWAIALTCTVPLLIILFTNQISMLLKASSDREDTLTDVMKFLPNSSLIIHFDSSAEAMEYLIKNIPRAKDMYNTRFAIGSVEESDPINVRLTKRFDDVVWATIQSGMNYHLIVSPDHEAVATALQVSRNTYSAKHRATGICSCWVLGNEKLPLFQFCILEYPGHRELLFGWALTSSRSYAEKVFLIRDARLVQYFRQLFETHVTIARAAGGK